MISLYIMAVVVGADQLTKWWVLSSFALHESRVVLPGFFNLTYVTNTGAAFGFLAGAPHWWRQAFFVTVALAALAFLGYSYRQFQAQGRLAVWGVGCIAGGALGNLIDRLRLGSVVDFLDFYVRNHHWPAFNVADSAITIGVALFLLGAFLGEGEQSGVSL